MIIAETALAVTFLCSNLPNRKRSGEFPHYISSGSRNCFQIASGITLEAQVTEDIKNLPGVRSVSVQRNGSTFTVDVFMENLEIESFRRVSDKELALFDEFPDLNFNFMILPVEALEDMSFVSLHAA